MRTNVINLCFYGNSQNVNALTGHYTSDFETKQIATYTVLNGIATILELVPLIKTELNLPLPFVVNVRDLGSGYLRNVDINAETGKADESICPTSEWLNRRQLQPAPSIGQTLQSDFIGQL